MKIRLHHVKMFAFVAFISLLFGCGHRSTVLAFRVEQVAWSPNGKIAVVFVDRSSKLNLAILSSTDYSHAAVQSTAGIAGWSHDGRYLLYKKESLGSTGGLSNSNLYVFDSVTTSSKAITDGQKPINQATWASDDFAYTSPIDFPQEIHASVRIQSLQEKVLSEAQAPVGLLPTRLVYDTPRSRFVCSATIISEGMKYYNCLYTIEGQHFVLIPGSIGYSRSFAFDPGHSLMVVALCDKNERIHRIDRMDTSQTPPVFHPLLSEGRLPRLSKLDSMQLSQDGRRLLISAAPPRHACAIYCYEVASDSLTKIGEGLQPCFSGDGMRIAYIENGTSRMALGSRVFVCKIDGTDNKQIF